MRHTPVTFIWKADRYGQERAVGRQCQHCGIVMTVAGNARSVRQRVRGRQAWRFPQRVMRRPR